MRFLKTTIFCLVIFLSTPGFAQDEILDFLKAAPEDAERITELYTRPLFKGFGLGLNNGWYNTAATHKPLGVSFTLNGTAAFFPSSDKFYVFRNDEYVSLRLSDNALDNDRSPTAVGPDRNGPQVDIYDPNTGITVGSLDLPPGVGLSFNAIPVAVPQASIGLVKNTDVMVRYLPEFKIGDDGKIKFWGIGLKHDIKQWIPGMRYLPFHLSLMFGYTNMDAEYDFTEFIDPQDEKKTGEYDVRATTVQALISKKNICNYILRRSRILFSKFKFCRQRYL